MANYYNFSNYNYNKDVRGNMKYTESIVENLTTIKAGNRSFTQSLLKRMREDKSELEVADIILELIAISVMEQKALASTASQLTKSIARFLMVDFDGISPKQLVNAGIVFINTASDVIAPDKHSVDTGKEVKEMWFLTSTDEVFTKYCHDMAPTKQVLDPRLGQQRWTGPTLRVNEYDYEIVRKARRYGVIHWYRQSKMPLVYDALNRLGETEWVINEDLLAVLGQSLIPGERNLIPVAISEEERSGALGALRSISGTARFIEELRFEEYYKWGVDNELEKPEQFATARSKQDAEDWKLAKEFDHKEVISSWSVRMDFEKIIAFANEYKGSILNFTYSCDTRGRVYAIHPYLNPQGSDAAKSLLCFANPKPVSAYDLYVHISNCAGNDKDSFDSRVEWVRDRQNQLLGIANDPWGHWDTLVSFGVPEEKKTRLQFIAACIELKRLCDWIAEGNEQDEFLCRIPVGLDATSSGVQILTAIGRDDKAAEYVNLCKTRDGKVGDMYQFVFDEGVAPLLPSLQGKSDQLDTIIKEVVVGHKLGRKMVKRPAMTYSYSATMQGMGNMYYEDRKSAGDTLWSGISVKDAKALGSITYQACESMLEQSAKLMKFMRDGVKYHNGGAIISWTLPDGFKAFQCKDKSKMTMCAGTISEINVNVGIEIFQDIPHKQRHANAISPDIVHSLDAYLLRSMAIGLPADANLHFIHDQFGVDSCYVMDLQDLAKDTYLAISCRDNFKAMCAEAFGIDRELPESGKWDPQSIHSAEFVIC